MVTTGPVRTAVISPCTLKSSSTFSSRRALRSSAILSSFCPLCSGASSNRSMLGSWKLANISRCFAGAGRDWAGAGAGSAISGARRGSRSGAAGCSASSSSRSAGLAARFCRLGTNGRSISASAGLRFNICGRVKNCAQSMAKTRAVSVNPPPSASRPTRPTIQPEKLPPKRLATASILPAPSRPANPPAPAGNGPGLSSNSRAITVPSNTIARRSSANGPHHRPGVSSSSAFSTPVHKRRAEIHNSGNNSSAGKPK